MKIKELYLTDEEIHRKIYLAWNREFVRDAETTIDKLIARAQLAKALWGVVDWLSLGDPQLANAGRAKELKEALERAGIRGGDE